MTHPFGGWSAYGQPVVADRWKSSGNWGSDYAFCVLGYGGLNGRTTVGQAVGHFGLLVERADIREWMELGYPARGRFDGSQMWSCVGDFAVALTFDEIGKAGDLTAGASGGPWVIPNTDYVNGVVSYDVPSYPDVSFSPFFDREVLALYRRAFPIASPDDTETSVAPGLPSPPEEVTSIQGVASPG